MRSQRSTKKKKSSKVVKKLGSARVRETEQGNARRGLQVSPQRQSELQSSRVSSVTGALNGVHDPSVQNTLQTNEEELSGTEEFQSGFEDKDPSLLDNLTEDILEIILSYLPLHDFFKVRVVSKQFKTLTRRDSLWQLRVASRPSEGAYSPMFFTIGDGGQWEWSGYDSDSWRRLPTLGCIPPPDPELFKDHLVAGGAGLLCVNVEKPPKRAKLIICNPVTKEYKYLPTLLYQRHPVLMHVKRLDDNNGYEVIVAGSSSIGTESLSKKTEVYSSKTNTWVEKGDLPGPEFGLNEYQNGAYFKDDSRCLELLLCIAVLEGGGKGVIVYDMKLGKWRSDRIIQIPVMTGESGSSIIATSHILECGGSIYVFSEQEYGKEVSFCIHKFHIDPPEGEEIWEEMMNLKRKGSRGLLVYPEFTCLPISDHEISIFNTVENTMEVYDIEKGFKESKKIAAPKVTGKRFHSLNTLGFVFRPDFNAKV